MKWRLCPCPCHKQMTVEPWKYLEWHIETRGKCGCWFGHLPLWEAHDNMEAE